MLLNQFEKKVFKIFPKSFFSKIIFFFHFFSKGVFIYLSNPVSALNLYSPLGKRVGKQSFPLIFIKLVPSMIFSMFSTGVTSKKSLYLRKEGMKNEKMRKFNTFALISVRLWNFKNGWSSKARFLGKNQHSEVTLMPHDGRWR